MKPFYRIAKCCYTCKYGKYVAGTEVECPHAAYGTTMDMWEVCVKFRYREEFK